LAFTTWTGRTLSLPRPEAVRHYPVAFVDSIVSYLLVVSGRPEETPLVLVPGWWVEEDLQRLLSTLNVPVENEGPTRLTEIARRHAKANLPLSMRRPWLVGVSTLIPGIAYVSVMTYLITHL
jgi:hypothetical protein